MSISLIPGVVRAASSPQRFHARVSDRSADELARLELECFCRGDYDLVVKDKGYVRAVRNSKKDQ